MKCEFLTECEMCIMKSKAAETPIYCTHNSQFIYKPFGIGEKRKNAILKIEEPRQTQHNIQNNIEAESEDKE